MHSSASLLTPNTAFQVSIKAPKTSRRSIHVRCAAPHESQERPSRRALLVGASSIAALPLLTAPPADAKLVERVIPAKNLSASQKKDLLNDLQSRATRELSKVLTTADAPAALRLLLHDAATYDAKNRTGGVNGSIVMSEELNRPENADLKEIVGKLAKARDAIIASQNPAQAPLSWADTIVLAVKVTQENAWVNVLRERNPTNADYLAGNFANKINVRLGRVDATQPDPPAAVPLADASPQQVRDFFNALGVKDASELAGPFGRKPPFYERISFLLWTAAQKDPASAEASLATDAAFAPYKAKYDASRKMTFRLDYEVDFSDYLQRLTDLGARFDKGAYLYDFKYLAPDQL